MTDLDPRLNRRTFLMGALAAPVLAPSIARAAGPGEKLKLGIIGVGGRGEGNWSNLTNEEVLVLCDVDTTRVSKAHQVFPSAEVVQDFRRVIDRNDLDGVVISTPDHWHAIPSVWAMQTGKHVYCEKPLAHSIYEARVMQEAARKYKRVTQMGTQIHAGANYRRVVELVQAGAIGPVKRVDVWCEKAPNPVQRTVGTTPPPHLDYELWVGPAPWRPYEPGLVPFNWRWWWEFGGGVLADMACHYMDLPTWALGLRAPERVKADGKLPADSVNKMPQEMRVDFFHPSRGDRGEVQVTWWHGISGPRDANGQVIDTGYRNGVLFHGEKGQILADYGRHKLLPEEQFKDYQRPAPTIPDSVGHQREWADAIRNGGTPLCNFDYGGSLTETVLLGNVAYHLDREIEWDPKKLRVKNAKKSEWEHLIRREYRGDWTLKR